MLSRTLLHAFYWLDDGLQAYMRRHQGFSLPRAQSMIMICIGDGITRQADMARQLGVSKQAVQQALKPLIAKGLVTVEQDPADGRQRRVRFTAKGQRMRDVARRGLLELEAELARRIGRPRVDALHEALNAPWGPVPDDGLVSGYGSVPD
jgi:DNA-binding MarR family transcriptional regulator